MPISQESFIKTMNDMEKVLTDIGLSHLSTEKKVTLHTLSTEVHVTHK